MASGSCSSSAVPTLKWKYDVFLSFRGEDTRYTFVDHLHTALVQRGIFVFKDDEELKTGKPISLELLKAIEESRYAVVVFSENYANSSWCLAELAKIMECHKELGQKVIPVFYHVDPSDIRGQKNEVAVFFQQHEERFRQELDKVKEWREALTAVANLSGHHISKTINEGESSYIRKIVEGILANIQLCYTESNLVGIDSHMDKLNSLLRTGENDKVLIVGIHGMGGIGKTTIAKALFRRIAYKFESSSFVNDVRENSSSNKDLCALQEQVLKKILMTNKNFNVQDPEDGAYMIKARFKKRKVLMVLDDVDDWKQLEFLAATHDWFGPGSRIIITTRNEHLLSNANAKYKPQNLQKHEALELFSRHAFKRGSPPEDYKELSRRAILYAGYLPLAVKVLGSFFRGREADVWESALNRLAKEPNVEIFKTLKLSFDGLGDSEKKIFLDIVCFYKGKLVPDVTKVFESCGFDPLIGISVLIEKSLITISKYNKICMHDLIQEMGWQIVRESFPNSRLWQLEDIRDSLKNNQNLKAIEGIVVADMEYLGLDHNEYKKMVGFNANVFERMNNLRLLDVSGKFTSSEPKFLPHDLRWLCWTQYPFTSLPMAQMSKLVGLEVGGTIQQFWNGQKVMPNLKIVKLEDLDYLTAFPDVSGAPNIEELKVSNCKKLVKFHKSLGSHKRISKLDVIGCKRLKRLPSRFEMESLRSLSFFSCSSLHGFPDVSGAPNIEELKMCRCKKLVEFHESLGYLKRIIKFEVIDCKRLKSLPSSFEMESLESLKVDMCSSLERFPDLSPCMVKLKKIELDCCSSIEGLLSSLGYLSSLQCLDLRRYAGPMCKEYPEEHGCFRKIITRMWKSTLQCGSVGKINTKSLESLPMSTNLQTLINSCSVTSLLLWCRPVESEVFLKNLQSFSYLEVLDLSGNTNLIRLPATMSHLSFLRWLTLNECHRLQILQGLPSSIQKLEANNCYSLEKIDDLSEEEYDRWGYISFVNCQKLLKCEDSKRYLEKMLRQLILKRCVAIDHEISIVIAGNKIPSWFKEEQVGQHIRVMIPPKCSNQIIGIAVCAVFPVDWHGISFFDYIWINFKRADGVCFPQKQFHIPGLDLDDDSEADSEADSDADSEADSVLAGEKGNMWLCYKPICSIWPSQHEDWSQGGTLLDWSEGGTLLISIKAEKAVSCAARVIYKEDVESTQQNSLAISMGNLFELEAF